MADFSKSDLKYTAYSWNTAEDDNKTIEGFPDNVPLNRAEGYEVLYFINRYMKDRNYSLHSTFEKIEEALWTRVPLDKRTHRNIKEWLETSYSF
ncbi:hypothetical protein AAEO56_09700 [Flavobacterium sp. DGU11]|uniref:Uncharacterized protein n=1 Tax=Flavobacterium arundinis TaxID=3139143 RepID=A0ABU9HWI4_9FLAO